MLRILQYSEGDLTQTNIDELDFQKTKWIDCHNPTQEELHKLSEKIFIQHQDLERCLDSNERPSAEELENFTLIIFKSPVRDPSNITTASFSLLVSEHLLITFRRQEVEGIKKLLSMGDEKIKHFFEKGTTHLAYQILEKVMDDYFGILDFVEERINQLEGRVFAKPEPKLVREIFTLKKTLIYFHKSLSANRDIMSGIHKYEAEHIDPEQAKLFRYVADDVVQLIDVVATYRDILTGVLDIYLSSVSNNINTVMKKMAAFASLILVPTLISGVYGMNFIHMPELYWRHGYYFSLGLMAGSVLILIYYFKRKNWF